MPKRSRIKDFLWRHSAGLAFFVMVVFVAFLGYVGYTYVTITKKFDAARTWDLPSRVYSDATQIVPGIGYPRSLLEPKLNHVGYHEVKGRVENPGEYRYVGDDLEIFLPASPRDRHPRVHRPDLGPRAPRDGPGRRPDGARGGAADGGADPRAAPQP